MSLKRFIDSFKIGFFQAATEAWVICKGSSDSHQNSIMCCS